MTLSAKVIAIESASQFSDKRPRVTLRIAGCDSMFNEIRFPVPEADCASDYRLDAELSWTLERNDQTLKVRSVS